MESLDAKALFFIRTQVTEKSDNISSSRKEMMTWYMRKDPYLLG